MAVTPVTQQFGHVLLRTYIALFRTFTVRARTLHAVPNIGTLSAARPRPAALGTIGPGSVPPDGCGQTSATCATTPARFRASVRSVGGHRSATQARRRPSGAIRAGAEVENASAVETRTTWSAMPISLRCTLASAGEPE